MSGTVTGARILVGQFLLEANSFAPGSTSLVDFEPAGLHLGLAAAQATAAIRGPDRA